MDKKSIYLLGFFFLTLLGFPISQDNDPSLFLALEILCTSARTTLGGWWGHVTCMYAYLYIEGGLKACPLKTACLARLSSPREF